tara:strand:- start:551 stop:757 length:207 start_codon:yes stop_codon:yes gene_type:complete
MKFWSFDKQNHKFRSNLVTINLGVLNKKYFFISILKAPYLLDSSFIQIFGGGQSFKLRQASLMPIGYK